MGFIASVARSTEASLAEARLDAPEAPKLQGLRPGDNFEPTPKLAAAESGVERSDTFHFKDVAAQYLADTDAQPKPSVTAQVFARVLGKTLMRRFSNLVACLGLTGFYPARREYPVLAPLTALKTSDNQLLFIRGQPISARTLALLYKPNLVTISEMQTKAAAEMPSQMHYEVLPPKEGKNFYSVVYYVGRTIETLPLPLIGRLYNWLRPTLFGTAKDWEPIQIDIDRDTGEPIGMAYESSNYSSEPSSFNTMTSSDMHLLTKLSKDAEGKWTRTLFQRNGASQASDIENPFASGPSPTFGFVAWNGSYDIDSSLRRRGYALEPSKDAKKLYPLPKPELTFLDAPTYSTEGFDLRGMWLDLRKQGHAVMVMPARKSASTRIRGFLNDRLRGLTKMS